MYPYNEDNHVSTVHFSLNLCNSIEILINFPPGRFFVVALPTFFPLWCLLNVCFELNTFLLVFVAEKRKSGLNISMMGIEMARGTVDDHLKGYFLLCLFFLRMCQLRVSQFLFNWDGFLFGLDLFDNFFC